MKVTVFPSARLSDTWLKKMSFGSTRVPDPLFPMAEHSLEGKFRRLRIRQALKMIDRYSRYRIRNESAYHIRGILNITESRRGGRQEGSYSQQR